MAADILIAWSAEPPHALHDVTLGLVRYLDGLLKAGIKMEGLPDDLREVGAYNTLCGGRKGNGARTALRNLVVLEGVEQTHAFLRSGSAGRLRLGLTWKEGDTFAAEREWLDLQGERAAHLLDDYGIAHPLLSGLDELFFREHRMTDHLWDEAIHAAPSDWQQTFVDARRMDHPPDRSTVVVALFVLNRPGTKFVSPEDWAHLLEKQVTKLRGGGRPPLWTRLRQPRPH